MGIYNTVAPSFALTRRLKKPARQGRGKRHIKYAMEIEECCNTIMDDECYEKNTEEECEMGQKHIKDHKTIALQALLR